MTELQCKKCGNRENFVATCVYKYMVNSKGDEITQKDMDELPEYHCEKCGSINISITVKKDEQT